MTALGAWLHTATRCLSTDSAAQVRTEIQEHYESAREAALTAGSSTDDAERIALAGLGDAKAANRQYRKVLLTRAESRMLRESNWEARAVCSSRLLKSLLLAIPALALLASAWLFLGGHPAPAKDILVGGIALGIGLVAPFLPIYTPSRAIVFRIVKWTALIAAIIFVFGADALKWSWLLAAVFWPMFWIELTRMSIRRKLPVTEWPKQLYL